MSATILFMIEIGDALDLVRERIAECKRVQQQNSVLMQELGEKSYWPDRFTGVIYAVKFAGKRHPDFKAPNKHGASVPKKGSDWARRFAAQQGHADQAEVIAEAFNIPVSLQYTVEGGHGSRAIGPMTCECGFLYFGTDGPYAMWIPDVPAEVAIEEAKGHTVNPEAKAFKPEIPGCRRIEQEEWDILVAQHKLAKKRAAQAEPA